jgi:ATP-dependent helicase HrpA
MVTDEVRARREAAVPTVTYPAELPITERIDELAGLIRDHQVVVVAGETGSGKSTQLPKLCLALGRGIAGRIGHTQPRRLAARTVAERIADELGVAVGGAVGCTVRFSDQVADETLVKVMTDGILLAETRHDRDLRAYDTIIIDEAHERSLNVDFLLGYLRRLLPRRPDLKLVITSATIDTGKFSAHFGGAPIVEVSGRTYPVEVRYRPFALDADDDRDQTQAIADAVEELRTEGPGDVLVFLSGEREIHDTADALRRIEWPDTEIVPLYARLGLAEQRRVFAPHRGRRVVLATNVAETSITVPGIRYVVDTGTARISRYSRRLKVQRLPIEPVSQASADQRAGRCGRVAPGVAIRLYAEDDYANRPAFTEPEILRTNLASVVLQAASLRLGDLTRFPFVDPPDRRAVNDGVALLEELGAFRPGETDPDRRLTPLGHRLARLPTDPRLGRMVLAAEELDCAREVLVIASALSIQDPRERPTEQRAAAEQSHARFRSEGSDFLAYLQLWDHLRELQRTTTKSAFRRSCRQEFLNFLRVREWQDVERQLRDTAAELGIRANRSPAEPDRIHRALLTGLLSHVGVLPPTDRKRPQGPTPPGGRPRERQPLPEYLGARNARFAIAPGSVLTRKAPKWVMAGELVETNRLWARTVAGVRPEWIEAAAGALATRSHDDPRWDRERGSVVATERVTLYGLPVAVRTVDYARIDPEAARELFIRMALVERQWDTHEAFFAANAAAVDRVRRLEDRARRRDLLVGHDAVFALLDARIPEDVTNGRALERWLREDRSERNARLTLSAAELIDPEAGGIAPEDFPDHLVIRDHRYLLTYAYTPGRAGDGITLHLPLAALQTLTDDDTSWMVPGVRRELVEAMMRALPKQYRRPLSPISGHVDAFLAAHSPADGPLPALLADYVNTVVRRETDGQVWSTLSAADFVPDTWPDHLRFQYAVQGTDREVLAVGRRLGVLAVELRPRLRAAVVAAHAGLERRGQTSWTFDEIPGRVGVEQSGHRIVGYPALVDERTSVGLDVVMSAAEQARSTRAGVRRLLLLTIVAPRRQLERLVGNAARLALPQLRAGTVEELVDDAVGIAVDVLVGDRGAAVRDQATFDALREDVRGELHDAAARVVGMAAAIAETAATTLALLAPLSASAFDASVADLRAQLRWLAGPGFVRATGSARLGDVERYVRAARARAEKLAGDLERDRRRMAPIRRLQDEIDDVLVDAPPERRVELMALRWDVEELRVAAWAQQLGTRSGVSETRIRRDLDRIAPVA